MATSERHSRTAREGKERKGCSYEYSSNTGPCGTPHMTILDPYPKRMLRVTLQTNPPQGKGTLVFLPYLTDVTCNTPNQSFE